MIVQHVDGPPHPVSLLHEIADDLLLSDLNLEDADAVRRPGDRLVVVDRPGWHRPRVRLEVDANPAPAR